MVQLVVFSGIYTVIAIVCSGLFVYRRDHEPIKSREWVLSIFATFFAYVFFVADSISFDIRHQDFGDVTVFVSCDLELWPSIYFIVMWTTPLFLRAFILYFRFRLQQRNMEAREKKEFTEWMYRYRWMLGWKAYMLVYLIVFVAFTILELILHYSAGPISEYYIGYTGCISNNEDYLIMIQGILAIIALCVSIYFLWLVKDQFGIKNELIAILSVGLPMLIIWALVIFGYGSIIPAYVPSEIFEMLTASLTYFPTIVYPLVLTYTPKFAAKVDLNQSTVTSQSSDSGSQLSTSTGTGTGVEPEATKEKQKKPLKAVNPSSFNFFKSCLQDPVMLPAFQKFCMESWCVENLLFYQDALDYMAKIEEHAPEEILEAKAKDMESLYFSEDAPMQLNLEAAMIEQVHERISENQFNSALFEDAFRMIVSILRSDSFRKFMRMSEFEEAFNASELKKKYVLSKNAPIQQSNFFHTVRLKTAQVFKGGDEDSSKDIVELETVEIK